MRRAKVYKVGCIWQVLIIEEAGPNTSPAGSWMPIFFKATEAHAEALKWAISALEEYYRPYDWEPTVG